MSKIVHNNNNNNACLLLLLLFDSPLSKIHPSSIKSTFERDVIKHYWSLIGSSACFPAVIVIYIFRITFFLYLIYFLSSCVQTSEWWVRMNVTDWWLKSERSNLTYLCLCGPCGPGLQNQTIVTNDGLDALSQCSVWLVLNRNNFLKLLFY